MNVIVKSSRAADKEKMFILAEGYRGFQGHAGFVSPVVVDLQSSLDDRVESECRMAMNGRDGPFTPSCRHRLESIGVSVNNGPRIRFLESREIVEREWILPEKAGSSIDNLLRIGMCKQLE